MNDFGNLIEPAPVEFTFSAPGWYVLGSLVLVVLFLITLVILRYNKKNKYRKTAVLMLDSMQSIYIKNSDYRALLFETTMLIKRIAIARYGRTSAAALRGTDFLNFMNSKWKSKAFTHDDVRLCSGLIYTEKSIGQAEATAFVSKARRWIRRHYIK